VHHARRCEGQRASRAVGGQRHTLSFVALRGKRAAAIPMARSTLVVCAAALAWAPLGAAVNKARDLSTVSQSALKLWVTVDARVDVDGGRVAQWNDISHGENHVKQNSAGATADIGFSFRLLISLPACGLLG
jgi:hypothetical protein